MTDLDEKLLREAIRVAGRARANGNHPFGAVLADADGNPLLEAENTVVTANDPSGHAETNLVRAAWQAYDPAFLATCSLYTSTEPCPMCSGAIFWGNVRRVVYALSQERLYALFGEQEEEVLPIACRKILGGGGKQIEVIGPLLEDEAMRVHEGFWV
jgi:tRNA(Arg) A34 adenosine deaminase TadA